MPIELLRRFDGQPCPERYIDLTRWDPTATLDYFDALTASGEIALHGTGSHVTLLEPRQAFDASSERGCLRAVYATVCAPQALYRAIYDKFHARWESAHQDFMELSGFSTDGWNCEFRFMPYNLERVTSANPMIITDGYIYAIQKRLEKLKIDQDRPYDLISEKHIIPTHIFKVSRSVGEVLFGSLQGAYPGRFSVRAYSPEECLRHQAAVAAAKRMPNDIRSQASRAAFQCALKQIGVHGWLSK